MQSLLHIPIRQNIVDVFLNNYGVVTIKDLVIPGPRLITPSVTLLLSNVTPIFPNEFLDTLKNLDLKLMSPIHQTLLTAVSEDKYTSRHPKTYKFQKT